jgi:hypothetical protein
VIRCDKYTDFIFDESYNEANADFNVLLTLHRSTGRSKSPCEPDDYSIKTSKNILNTVNYLL